MAGLARSHSAAKAVPTLARNRYRFQGREWSIATGLTNFRMRWYNAETGRWLSKDPIGLSGGLNYYVFCGNRPIWSVDFSGCCPEITDVKNDFIPEWINAYNEILYDDYGEVLEVSDSCGVVGLCSLAIYGLTSAYTSIVDALAEDQIRTAKLAGVNTKGSLTTKILASDKGMKIAARTQMIKAGLSKVNAAGAVISTAATGFSLGARMNAATRATIRVLSK